jgi:actin-like ATPase involved in cell morphogenesis
MHSYGLDFGTTTTYLTESSSGKVIHIPLGIKGLTNPDDGDAMYSRVVSNGAKLEAGRIDGKRSLKSMLAGGRESGFSESELETHIEALFSRVIQTAHQNKFDLTKENSVQIGCPAAWDKAPREKLFKLAQKAGFGLVDRAFIEEPVAAGLAWVDKYGESETGQGVTLVFDMGGGTLDVAVLDIKRSTEGVSIYVLGSRGNMLAGDSVDDLLLQRAISNSGGQKVDKEVALPSIEMYKKILAMDPEKESVEVILGAGTVTSISQKDLDFAQKDVIHASLATINKTLTDAFLLDLLKHSGIDPLSQMPGIRKDGELEDTFFEPKFPGWLVDEWKNVKVEELHKSVANVILAGGMSNSVQIQNALKKVFTKATFFMGLDPLGSHQPDSASRVISLGVGSTMHLRTLNLAKPDFDILVGGNCHYEAFADMLDSDQVAVSAPVLRKVVFGGNDGLVEIKYIGRKPQPMKDGKGSTITLSSLDRTILYPNATFVAFESSGRRVEVAAEDYAIAGFASRFDPKDEIPQAGGIATYQRDTHDIRFVKRNDPRSLAPICSVQRVEAQLKYRSTLSSIWIGVEYLRKYVEVLTEICMAKPKGKPDAVREKFLATLEHGSIDHKSCQPKWFAFLIASMCILDWSVPSPWHIEKLRELADSSDFKNWSRAWFDEAVFLGNNRYPQINIQQYSA